MTIWIKLYLIHGLSIFYFKQSLLLWRNSTVIGQNHEKLSLISLIFVIAVFVLSFNPCWLVQDMMDKLSSSWATDRCSLCGSCESMANNESHQIWRSQSCKWRTWKIQSNCNLIECIFSLKKTCSSIEMWSRFYRHFVLTQYWVCK